MRRAAVLLARVAAGIVAIVFGYLLAGTLGALIPRNAAWRPPGHGVTIWVEDNGIHTGLVLPKQAAGIDWRGHFPATDLPDPRFGAYDHVAIGWGERNFYLGTPTWRDVDPSTVLGAAFGSDATLLHVEHVARPVADAHVRPIVLRPDEYRRLAALIRARRGDGAPLPGYARYDVFYPATGHYDAVRTCNAWTGDTLATAGVRVGWWTPFASSVMQWF